MPAMRSLADRSGTITRLRLEGGAGIAAKDDDAAMNLAGQCRHTFADDIAPFDVLVVPSAPGAAPLG